MPQAQIDFTVFDYSISNAAELDTRDATLASAEVSQSSGNAESALTDIPYQFSVQFTNNIHVTSDGSGIQVVDSCVQFLATLEAKANAFCVQV